MTREDVRPVCMFCQTRFSLAAGKETPCESWRSLDRQHVERRVATPEQLARMRPDAEPANNMRQKAKPDSDFGFTTLMDPDDPPIWNGPAKRPAPTPPDAAALRAGKPATGQTSLF